MLSLLNMELIYHGFIYVESAAPYLGDGVTKTLRQLHAEEDDEERFQADLKQAVRQSLGKLSPFFFPFFL